MKIKNWLLLLILIIFHFFNIQIINNYQTYDNLVSNKQTSKKPITILPSIVEKSLIVYTISHIELDDETNLAIDQAIDFIMEKNDINSDEFELVKLNFIASYLCASSYGAEDWGEYFAEVYKLYMYSIFAERPIAIAKIYDDYFWNKLPEISRRLKSGESEVSILKYVSEVESSDYVIENVEKNSLNFNTILNSEYKYIYEFSNYWKELFYTSSMDKLNIAEKDVEPLSEDELNYFFKELSVFDDILNIPYYGTDWNYKKRDQWHWQDFELMNEEFKNKTKFKDSQFSGLMLKEYVDYSINYNNHKQKRMNEYVTDDLKMKTYECILITMNLHYNIAKIEFWKTHPYIYGFSEYTNIIAAGVYHPISYDAKTRGGILVNEGNSLNFIGTNDAFRNFSYYQSTLYHEIGHAIHGTAFLNSNELDRIKNHDEDIETTLEENHYSKYEPKKMVIDTRPEPVEDNWVYLDEFNNYDTVKVYVEKNSSIRDIYQSSLESIIKELEMIENISRLELTNEFYDFGYFLTENGQNLNFDQSYIQKIKNNEDFILYYYNNHFKDNIKLDVDFVEQLPEYYAGNYYYQKYAIDEAKFVDLEQKYKEVNKYIKQNWKNTNINAEIQNIEYYIGYSKTRQEWNFSEFERMYNMGKNTITVPLTIDFKPSQNSHISGYIILETKIDFYDSSTEPGGSSSSIPNGFDWLVLVYVLIGVVGALAIIFVVIIFSKEKNKVSNDN